MVEKVSRLSLTDFFLFSSSSQKKPRIAGHKLTGILIRPGKERNIANHVHIIFRQLS